MTLKDLLKKNDKIKEDITPAVVPMPSCDPSTEVMIMRSDTNTQEVIRPPTFASDDTPAPPEENSITKRLSRLRSSSNVSTTSKTSNQGDKSERRLSQRLHLRSGSRASSQSSINLPRDLPDIQDLSIEGEEKEAKWEERATLLGKQKPNSRPYSQELKPRPTTPDQALRERLQGSPKAAKLGDRPGVGTRSISSAKGDENIQEAIRLHEAGDLARSTAMFGRLAEGNAMAQIMFGLALRHGWGIPQDAPLAIQYLSAAASNSASIEAAALESGMKKGGAAKGELVLSIYELANSFRHGWGVQKDAVAARKYYETAANLGDPDAMNEVARCYEMGNGGKKDRVSQSFLLSAQATSCDRFDVIAPRASMMSSMLIVENSRTCSTCCEDGGCIIFSFRPALPLSTPLKLPLSPTIPPHSLITTHHTSSDHVRHQRISLIPFSHLVHSSAILSPGRTKRKQNPGKLLVSHRHLSFATLSWPKSFPFPMPF